jgi:hypothetical protein
MPRARELPPPRGTAVSVLIVRAMPVDHVLPLYHLVCEECGSVMDFEMPEYSDIHKKAERLTPFKISRYRIDFFGLCEKCQKKQKIKRKRKAL